MKGGAVGFDGNLDGTVALGPAGHPIASGAIHLKYANGSMAGSSLTLTQAQVQIPGAAISLENFTLNIGDGFKLTPAGAPKIKAAFGTFATVEGTVALANGSISGITAKAHIGDTPMTQAVDLTGFTWDAGTGDISGTGKITLKDLGGLIQSGAQIDVGYAAKTWSASGSVTVSTGLFQGWTVGAKYDGGVFSATLKAGGTPWTVGGATLTVASGTEVTYVVGSGVSGTISAGISVLGQSGSATVTLANNQISDVVAQANIHVQDIVPILMGDLEIKYQKAGNKFSIEGKDIKVNVDGLRDKVAVKDVKYDNGKLSGTIDFNTGDLEFMSLKGSASGSMTIDGSNLTGKAHVAASAGAIGGVEGDIEYAGGAFKITGGSVNINLDTVSGGMLSGTLKGGGGAGGVTASCQAQFKAEPLKTTFGEIKVDYANGNITASFTLDAAKLPKITGADYTFSAPISISKPKSGAFSITGTGHGTLKVGTWLSASVTAGFNANKFSGSVTIAVGGLPVKPPGMTITGAGTIKYTEDGHIQIDSGSHLDLDVLERHGEGRRPPRCCAGDNLTGVSVTGKVKATAFTNAGAVHRRVGSDKRLLLRHQHHLQGHRHPQRRGVKLHLTAEGGAFKATATDITFKEPLQNFSIPEAHVGTAGMGCTIKGSGSVALGPASATIDPGSQLTVDSVAGVTGTVTGKAKLGPLPDINFKVTPKGAGQPVDIHADTTIQLSTIPSIGENLEGSVKVDYDRTGGANKWTFKGDAPNVKVPQLQGQKIFGAVDLTWTTGLDGTIAVNAHHPHRQGDELRRSARRPSPSPPAS